MKLTIRIQEQTYELQYSDSFLTKLGEHNLTLRAIQEELQQADDQLAQTQEGESFFLMGAICSLEGVKEADKLVLTRLIPSESVI